MALRRENEDLKTKVQELQDLVGCFVSKSKRDHLSRPGTLQRSSIQFMGKDISVNSAKSFLEAAQRATTHQLLNQPPPGLELNPAIIGLQTELSINHAKAYPKLMPFRNPSIIARDLLNPLRASRLDNLAR